MGEKKRKFCSKCGEELGGSDNYCSSCGHSIQERRRKGEKGLKIKNIFLIIVVFVIAWVLVRKFTNQSIIPEIILRLLKN